MGILIDTVRISGFRGIKNLEINLPRVTVFIGTNNAGKTSVLKALHLALGDYSRCIAEEDFHISADEKKVSEILTDVRIIPFDQKKQIVSLFNDEWATEFGDKIQSEANGQQFVALRTRVKQDHDKGSFDIKRATLEKWPENSVWQSEKLKETKMLSRFNSIALTSIDAQRDIHYELKERSSFMGKLLSTVKYEAEEVRELELLIQHVNAEAVNKSHELKSLKSHLEQLNHSFQGSGVAEITPFPKKIRDLSKHFSVHFGESSKHSFSMEYHGMGTRSWASMLTVKAFTSLMMAKYAEEVEPFFPILCAEEPEAHLHPNAQKTLYYQLAEFDGQVIMSTHSPYLAAMANQSELRCLRKLNDSVGVSELSLKPNTDEYRRLQREVIHSRGEILFSKSLVLCEGETEEQALPMLFKKYFGKEDFALGVNFIGVKGAGNYPAFLRFAKDFNIPVFIFSDGEQETIKSLRKQYSAVFGETEVEDCQNITLLNGTDFEGYLIESGFQAIIENAIYEVEGADFIKKQISKKDGTFKKRNKTNKPNCSTCKQPIYEDELRDYSATEGYKTALLDILDSCKTKYAPAIAQKLCELDKDSFPPKIIEFFEKVQKGAVL